ncbi:MAG: lipopolysaccharide heptosyltransferase II [Candidatus Neomarinimicrobiota bacterium]
MRIGIHSPNWVGDAVMSLLFVNRCRLQFPQDELVVVAKSWVSAIFQNHPFIGEVVVLESDAVSGGISTTKTGRRLRRSGLDMFFILPDSWRSAYLAWLSGAEERIGFRGQYRSFLFSQAVSHSMKSVHRSVEYLSLLSDKSHSPKEDITGIQVSDEEKEWARAELTQLGLTKPIAVFPSSVAPSRRVPMEKWEKILDLAIDAGHLLLFIGGSADKVVGDSLIERLGGNGARSVCGNYSLRQSIALISKCDGAISTDTGLGHIAANLGLKTISLFGAGDPSRTAPLGSRTIVITENVYCSPCRKNVCENSEEPLICLKSIDASKVWESYLSL